MKYKIFILGYRDCLDKVVYENYDYYTKEGICLDAARALWDVVFDSIEEAHNYCVKNGHKLNGQQVVILPYINFDYEGGII